MKSTHPLRFVFIEKLTVRIRKLCAATALINLIFLTLLAQESISGNFRIQPTSLDLDKNVKSGSFSVINSGNDKLNVQIDLKEWSQGADGKDEYQDTKDIIFFPKIMTIEPNEQRVIRIGAKGAPPLVERTYRLFVSEIPSQKKKPDELVKGKIAAGLTIAFQYATPIFVKPVRSQQSASIENINMSKGEAKAFIRNTGNVHIKLRTVTFRGKGPDGQELFSKEAAGWYVLNSQARAYAVTVPKDICRKLATIEIHAQADNLAINGTLNVQRKMCAQ